MKALLISPEDRISAVVEKDWTLEELQAEVGGYVEAVRFGPNAVVLVDEEGLLKGKLHGFVLPGVPLLVGRAVVLGDNGGEDWVSVPESVVELIQRNLRWGKGRPTW
jgi:hypothetical protein